jgi:uncharacterized protein (TIGR00255 family)
MLKSMTGYGSAETATDKYIYKVELKSLNGKFLELNLRLPKMYNDKEVMLRNYISGKLVRGSVNVFINIEKQKGSEQAAVTINSALATEYYKNWKNLAETLDASDDNILSTIMQMPDMVKSEDQGYDESEWQQLVKTVDTAISNLETFRVDEGNTLLALLTKHCNAIKKLIPEVEFFETERMEITKTRLKKNLDDLINKEGYDKNRFEQELIYYLEKLDITEEKNRLQAHCEHFAETLKEADSGRKLNFIAQEIGREINTMGAKANHAGMQKCVVQMKEELEKIKEQVLNVL